MSDRMYIILSRIGSFVLLGGLLLVSIALRSDDSRLSGLGVVAAGLGLALSFVETAVLGSGRFIANGIQSGSTAAFVARLWGALMVLIGSGVATLGLITMMSASSTFGDLAQSVTGRFFLLLAAGLSMLLNGVLHILVAVEGEKLSLSTVLRHTAYFFLALLGLIALAMAAAMLWSPGII